MFEWILNKWIKEDTVGVLLGVLINQCNIFFFIDKIEKDFSFDEKAIYS